MLCLNDKAPRCEGPVGCDHLLAGKSHHLVTERNSTRAHHQVNNPCRKNRIALTRDRASACALFAGHGCRSKEGRGRPGPLNVTHTAISCRKVQRFWVCVMVRKEGMAESGSERPTLADRSTAGNGQVGEALNLPFR